MWDGFLCCLLASILFGSVFVPMRRHPMGDGYYAQLFFSLGAFLITFPIGIYYPPTVYPLVMFGGALWCFDRRLPPTVATTARACRVTMEVLYFKEITGNRNITLLAVAYSLTLVGVAVITASRTISL
ncbi:unnamed protein product, partial [Mesorhabditis spiculigera]